MLLLFDENNYAIRGRYYAITCRFFQSLSLLQLEWQPECPRDVDLVIPNVDCEVAEHRLVTVDGKSKRKCAFNGCFQKGRLWLALEWGWQALGISFRWKRGAHLAVFVAFSEREAVFRSQAQQPFFPVFFGWLAVNLNAFCILAPCQATDQTIPNPAFFNMVTLVTRMQWLVFRRENCAATQIWGSISRMAVWPSGLFVNHAFFPPAASLVMLCEKVGRPPDEVSDRKLSKSGHLAWLLKTPTAPKLTPRLDSFCWETSEKRLRTIYHHRPRQKQNFILRKIYLNFCTTQNKVQRLNSIVSVWQGHRFRGLPGSSHQPLPRHRQLRSSLCPPAGSSPLALFALSTPSSTEFDRWNTAFRKRLHSGRSRLFGTYRLYAALAVD